MKKILFWLCMPIIMPIVSTLFLLGLVASITTTIVEYLHNRFTYFEGWCYDLPKQGYKFKDGLWIAHWKKVDGKMINMMEDVDD